jgi:hypothetical protein
MAEQQRQEQPVEHEAAVATAVPDPQGADADQTAHAVARHRRDQGACCDGRQADFAERAQAGAQRADDGIPAVQTEWPFALTAC